MATATAAKAKTMKLQKVNVSQVFPDTQELVTRSVRNVTRDTYTQSLHGTINFAGEEFGVVRLLRHRIWNLA